VVALDSGRTGQWSHWTVVALDSGRTGQWSDRLWAVAIFLFDMFLIVLILGLNHLTAINDLAVKLPVQKWGAIHVLGSNVRFGTNLK
jgi:hypothetical protein